MLPIATAVPAMGREVPNADMCKIVYSAKRSILANVDFALHLDQDGSGALIAEGMPMGAVPLIGNWKLISWQVVTETGAIDLFGPKPNGHLILTGEGRMMAITTAEGRTPGETDAERAALHKSMLAYTGRYRVEGDEFITTVDASWNEGWNGTEQRRRFRLDGDTLYIESAPAPSITSPGKVDFRRIVWQRER